MSILETKADFAISGHSLVDATLDRREDAIARTYLRARCIGPTALSNPSLGLLYRVWEAWVEHGAPTHTVYVRSSTNSVPTPGPGTWSAPIQVFQFTGAPILELDLAFAQNGEATIAAERGTGPAGASQVWLYWFKPTDGTTVFEMIATGRTPRLLLDSPTYTPESDLLLFYLDGDGVFYRVQSAVFAVAVAVPSTGWGDLGDQSTGMTLDLADFFLEDVAIASDFKLQLIGSQRHVATGTYRLLVLNSAPYPVRMTDAASIGHRSQAFQTELVVLSLGTTVEAASIAHALLSVSTESVLVTVIVVAEASEIGHAATLFVTEVVVQTATLVTEASEIGHAALGLSTETILFEAPAVTEATAIGHQALSFAKELV